MEIIPSTFASDLEGLVKAVFDFVGKRVIGNVQILPFDRNKLADIGETGEIISASDIKATNAEIPDKKSEFFFTRVGHCLLDFVTGDDITDVIFQELFENETTHWAFRAFSMAYERFVGMEINADMALEMAIEFSWQETGIDLGLFLRPY